jgi:hypothetical protein
LEAVSVNFVRNVVVFCVTKYILIYVQFVLERACVGARARVCGTEAVTGGQISTSHISREACKRCSVATIGPSSWKDSGQPPATTVMLPGIT